ncbi:MAG TPA: hypothetical protein VM409_06895 [Chloroflexia bacterium]|nr:hypothetical protein [Chloroflexia bacterium]
MSQPVSLPYGREMDVRKRWMWHTAISGALGLAVGWLAVGFAAGLPRDSVFLRDRWVNLTYLGIAIVAGFVVGAIVGGAQARCLSRYLPVAAARRWTAASGLAGAVSALLAIPWTTFKMPAAAILDKIPFASYVLAFVVAGAIFGTSQWLVLRAYLPGAGRWVPACAAGAGAAAMLTVLVLVVTSLPPLSYLVLFTFTCMLGIPFYLLIGAAIFLPPGAITGATMVKLLKEANLL